MSNYDDRCATCNHTWHGMTCHITECACPTAWTEPQGDVA